jgi:hypothetical protein
MGELGASAPQPSLAPTEAAAAAVAIEAGAVSAVSAADCCEDDSAAADCDAELPADADAGDSSVPADVAAIASTHLLLCCLQPLLQLAAAPAQQRPALVHSN